jgi:hypothetical protein
MVLLTRARLNGPDHLGSKITVTGRFGADKLVVVGWMSLYEDFGPGDNVFTDVRSSLSKSSLPRYMAYGQLRNHYRQFMKSTFNLSPQERSLLYMNKRNQPQPGDVARGPPRMPLADYKAAQAAQAAAQDELRPS